MYALLHIFQRCPVDSVVFCWLTIFNTPKLRVTKTIFTWLQNLFAECCVCIAMGFQDILNLSHVKYPCAKIKGNLKRIPKPIKTY